MPSLSQVANQEYLCSQNPTLGICRQYPMKRLILDEKGEVIEIILYKSPTNGEPPV